MNNQHLIWQDLAAVSTILMLLLTLLLEWPRLMIRAIRLRLSLGRFSPGIFLVGEMLFLGTLLIYGVDSPAWICAAELLVALLGILLIPDDMPLKVRLFTWLAFTTGFVLMAYLTFLTNRLLNGPSPHF